MIFEIVEKDEVVYFVEPTDLYGSVYYANELVELLWSCGWFGSKQNWRLACYGGYENAIEFA